VPRKTVERVHEILREGKFRYSVHCTEKLADRVVTDEEDIRCVGRTAHSTRLQDGGSWRVTGQDECELEMTVVCRVLETRDLLLNTVY
jgi:hypothetical protein